jgi:3-oxoacyl-[acyl-carrier-protein] synthase-3
MRLDGREVFRFGVTKAVEMIKDAMARHNLKAADIGAIIPHQANLRIIDAAIERLDLPRDLFVVNLQKYGNTSSASVPLALDEANRAGRIPKGKAVIMLAFGAGMTWASAVVQW